MYSWTTLNLEVFNPPRTTQSTGHGAAAAAAASSKIIMQACVMSHAGLSSRLHQADASTSSARFGSRRFFSSAFLNPSSTQTTRVRPQSRFGERWRRTARGTTTTTRAGLQVDQEDMRIVDFYELMVWRAGGPPYTFPLSVCVVVPALVYAACIHTLRIYGRTVLPPAAGTEQSKSSSPGLYHT